MTTQSNEHPILIAGGGIGGFAAALALARKGRAVHIIEQSGELGEVGAGIQLGPNVFRMFRVLGITEAINDVAVFPDALVMMDALSGEQITRIPLNTKLFQKHFNYPYGVIYRPDLHQVLIDACERQHLVTHSLGQKILRYAEHDSGVEVHLESGESLSGAALIGADGLWSTIRGQMREDGPPTVSGHIAYRAVLPAGEVPETSRNNSVVLWAGPKTHLVHYPLHRGDIY
ncbi:MAG: FAD-dependent oxidoreductase, partial [Rhizobiales bacterium]|nr:FAD-dependent oxidoreductase [Hyphomicrobiales bacterium]